MKKTVIAMALLGISASAAANEGMWMPKQLPQIAKDLKAAGLKLDPSKLTQLTDFPMGAIVSLGGCSASFVSPQGLVATNHHCIYGSVAYNSKPDRNYLENGFVSKSLDEELPAPPGSRIYVTKEVTEVSKKVIDAETAKLNGKKRVDAIEKNIKEIVTACEKDAGHRCNVSSFYGGLEYYLIKQLEIRDVRLVYSPPLGVGKFGGDTDNWMWPRHTGDFGFYRAYVSKDGKAADFSKDNVPYVPKHHLKLSQTPLSEGDFVMVLGYPGRTNRHRLPSEVDYTFTKDYPDYVKSSGETLAIIEKETAGDDAAKLKYAGQVAGINNYYKNRQGMLESYSKSDFLARKTKEHADLKAWINSNPARAKEFAADIVEVEKLLAERDATAEKNSAYSSAIPRFLSGARTLYRLANERVKPDAERKAGFQERDLPRFKASMESFDKQYVEKVDKAIVFHFLKGYLAKSAEFQNAEFNNAMGVKPGMTDDQIRAQLDKLYAGSKIGDIEFRRKLLAATPAEFKTIDDTFVKAAVALYEPALKKEAEAEELAGKIQKAYANYMKAKIAYMNSKGLAVYPDANSTLRITFGKVASRGHGTADGLAWSAFTTVDGIVAKHTGKGEFNAPANQLAAIKAKDFGPFADAKLKNMPVNYLATLDITGGNSGSAALNAKGELIGLAFDGTLDSIISDWDYNDANTRSIQVDWRYMLWQMKHVDKAERLVNEMGVK